MAHSASEVHHLQRLQSVRDPTSPSRQAARPRTPGFTSPSARSRSCSCSSTSPASNRQSPQTCGLCDRRSVCWTPLRPGLLRLSGTRFLPSLQCLLLNSFVLLLSQFGRFVHKLHLCHKYYISTCISHCLARDERYFLRHLIHLLNKLL